ncbi:MAG: hypothetical protein MJY58_03340 [Bacteroidaceae bacterium]|nr:hypothetical protein [Bacteroidaceae bacterium]
MIDCKDVNYVAPHVKAVEVKSQRMLCTSNPMNAIQNERYEIGSTDWF